MRPLSARDSAGLQRAILALHSHRDLASFRRAVPGIFLDLIPASYFGVSDARLDLEHQSYRVLDLWESRPVRVGRLLEALERSIYEQPFIQHLLEHGPCGPMILSDFLTLPQLRRTRVYREVFRPANIGRLLSAPSAGGPGVAASFAWGYRAAMLTGAFLAVLGAWASMTRGPHRTAIIGNNV